MDLLTRVTKEQLPFATLLGIDIVSAEPDKMIAEMMVSRRTLHPARRCENKDCRVRLMRDRVALR